MTSNVWKSVPYRKSYEWLLANLRPGHARGHAFSSGMIQQNERKALAVIVDTQKHNEELLSHLERRQECYPCLVDIVSEMGCVEVAERLRQGLPLPSPQSPRQRRLSNKRLPQEPPEPEAKRRPSYVHSPDTRTSVPVAVGESRDRDVRSSLPGVASHSSSDNVMDRQSSAYVPPLGTISLTSVPVAVGESRDRDVRSSLPGVASHSFSDNVMDRQSSAYVPPLGTISLTSGPVEEGERDVRIFPPVAASHSSSDSGMDHHPSCVHYPVPATSAVAEIADPLKLPAYNELRLDLIETMNMGTARTYAEGVSLITSLEEDNLRTVFEPKGRFSHNRELFRVMEIGGEYALRTFADKVLAKLGPSFAKRKERLEQILDYFK